MKDYDYAHQSNREKAPVFKHGESVLRKDVIIISSARGGGKSHFLQEMLRAQARKN